MDRARGESEIAVGERPGGLTEEEFFTRLGIAGGPAYTLKIRLSQDRIPRDQFVKEYAELAAQITDYEPVSFAATAQAAKETVAAMVRLVSELAQYIR